MSARYRWVLAQDEPPLIGYDQDLWVDRLHADETDTDGLIDLFEALRLANVTLWQRTPADQRQRLGIHAERGPESYDLAFRMIAGHDRFHLAQARRALEALRDVLRLSPTRRPRIAASSDAAPCLSSGSLPLPHFGDCTHEGHPREHGHCVIASSVAASQRSAVRNPRSAMPAPPG